MCAWLSASAVVASAQAPDQAARSRLRAEATAEASKFWDAHLSKCGDSYVGQRDSLFGLQLTQVMNARFRIMPRTLTVADRLNGTEWDGKAAVAGDAVRTMTYSQWSEWSSPSTEAQRAEREGRESDFNPWYYRFSLTKTKGAWKINDPQISKAPCSDVPPK